MSSRRLFLVAAACAAVALVAPASASAAVTARYTYAPSNPRAETTTTFDASGSVCDRKPCSYTWRDDLSDGPGGDSTLLGTGMMLYQTFHTAGNKAIRLTVTNGKGRASSTVKTIDVGATPPPPPPRCNNGQDDDGDGKTDYPADSGCDSAQDDSESPDPSPVDSDGDGIPDADDGCPNQAGPASNNGCPVPPPSNEPAPIAGQGYTLRFEDNFNSIDPASWRRSMYWDAEEPSDVFAESGVAHIQSRRSEGFPDRSLSTIDTEAGGIPDGGRTWTRGYFEARFRYTSATGANPAFWLMAASDALNPNWPSPPPRSLCPDLPASFTFCPSAELDMFEHFPVNGVDDFETALHRNTSGRWGMPDQVRANFNHAGGVELGSGWHVYAVKWTATEIRIYLDGVQLGNTLQPWDSFEQPMFLTFYMWTGVYGPGPNTSTPDVIETEVDWVRVWQH